MGEIYKKDQIETSDKKINKFMKFVWWEIVTILILLVFAIIGPYLFSQLDWGISFNETGPIGDTIGGITAPFVNLIAAFLVYKSFTAQIQANLDQREATKTQNDRYNDELKLLKKETSYNYIDKVLKNTISNYNSGKESVSSIQHLTEILNILLSNSLNPNEVVTYSTQEIESIGYKLLTTINQLTYCIEQISLDFKDDEKTKFFWTMQVQDFYNLIEVNNLFKTKDYLRQFKVISRKTPIDENKLVTLIELAITLRNKLERNYNEYNLFISEVR